MHPRRPQASILRTRWGALGEFAAAAFLVAAASGVALAAAYDPGDAYGSIAAMLLANPAAAFFRNLHYWSGQACLVLTLAHAADFLRTPAEQRLRRGVWLRLALALPLLAFVMLTGFLLRGDADARQALRIVTETAAQVPLAGPAVATLLFGNAERLELVYVHHAASATIAVWLFAIEHSRRVWPRAASLLAVTLCASAVSLFLSPGLHDGRDAVVKGPWYFLGLQEILHWTPRPAVAVGAGLALVAALYAVRVAAPANATRLKLGLLAALAAYAGLCVVAAFGRGENWQPRLAWPAEAGNPRAGFVLAASPPAPSPLPSAMGRPEGCLVCHRGVTGLGDAHRPEAVGCASCHGGDTLTLDKDRAHAGIRAIPGNLADAAASCGQAACHAAVIARVERSVMATMSGVVSVDRAVFGERSPAGPAAHVARLGHSPADTHLRQLCALCHLGAAKEAFGPNDEATRGGGCNACHLAYDAAALAALRRYERERKQGHPEAPTAHPALSLDIGNGQCFACHSRSGRIATSYEGWHEVNAASGQSPGTGRITRLVEGDRPFERIAPDVHHERGLDCIDCHTAAEVMGDGTAHAFKGGQLRIACADCHAPAGGRLATVPASSLDPESRRLLALRAWPGPAATRHAATAGGEALVNVGVDDAGRATLVRKRTGERLALKPAASACARDGAHARLSCASCHSAWAPRCVACHTALDPAGTAWDWLAGKEVRGEWVETSGPFRAGLPTLGVRRRGQGGAAPREVVDTFVPGMVLTIERPASAGEPARTLFRRLYAPMDPHTTRRESRSCTSCHNDPEALGYGRGELRYERTRAGGRWRFTPAERPEPADGLPADAWIAFLGMREGPFSTHEGARPFTVEEQRRILGAGACLTCHDGRSAVMREAVRDFPSTLARRSSRCLAPAPE